MPTLNWIGKKAVVNHHRAVLFHLLKNNDELSVGDPGSGNLLVQGDNLIALKALLPYYAGQVKCIYIDPPYNTGNENWVYNDNVNSPEMRDWLGKTVGREGEDLSRSDKWLCMMYPRLTLLRGFLREDGSIWISIDDDESHYLKAMCDEIFGRNNFVNNVIWQKKYSPQNDAKWLSDSHDHILVYARNKNIWRPNPLPRTEAMDARYRNPDNDPRGPWKPGDMSVKTYSAATDYPIKTPSGRVVSPPESRCWVVSKEKFEEMMRDNRITFGSHGNNVPAIKRFLSEVKQGVTSMTIWPYNEVGHNQEAKQELKDILDNSGNIFDTPKPIRLIQRILQIATDKNSLVMDSFGGSGTTGHAVYVQNAADGGIRRFILVEMDNNICRNITAQRLTRVSQGYNDISARGGGFRYCELSEPLFDERGNIRATVRFADLARHVYFTETGEPLPATKEVSSPLLGVHNGTAVYLLYNGILKDKTQKGGNVLTTNMLAALPSHKGNKVIYGTACRIDAERLRREGIVFKQLPYKLKVGVL